MKKLLASPLGTFIKGFFSIVLAMWVSELSSGHDLFSMDLPMIKKLIVAGIIPNIHILINWLNPEYKGYGANKLLDLDMYDLSLQKFRDNSNLDFDDDENLWILINCTNCVLEYQITPIEQTNINTYINNDYVDISVFNADKKPYPKGKY